MHFIHQQAFVSPTTSSEHRNMILNDRLLKERNLMEKISDNHQKMRMIKAKTLLKEVDESIHFEE